MNNGYHSLHLLEQMEQRQPLDENLISKSNLNIRDTKGRNALYWAIKNHSKRNVAMLLKHKVSFTVAPKLDAFFHAIETGNLEALMILISTGLNIDLQNDKGQSLLMKAIEHENIMMVQYLINQDIDLYLMDDKYDMALDYAKRCSFQRVFELVHYTVLNKQILEEHKDCVSCGVGQQSLCSIKQEF
jgi:ankyrin repeat protein